MACNIKKYTEIKDDLIERTMISDIRGPYISFEGYLIPTNYLKYSQKIENFEVYEDDIWICSFPKTGTTWTQETVWMIQNNLDYENAKEDINKRIPYFEIVMFLKESLNETEIGMMESKTSDSIETIRKMTRPRIIKTHLPYCLLPLKIRNGTVKPRIIYIYRDPRDTCLSYYNHHIIMGGFKGTIEDFCELFITGRVEYGPFFDHIFSFLRNSKDSNMLILQYEDMKADLESNIVKICKFLNKSIPSQEDMMKLLDHLSFENMKNNKYVNYDETVSLFRKLGLNSGDGSFMRKGKAGSYLEQFTPEMIQKFNEWISSNTEGTKLKFPEKKLII